ncbi:BppU family phage baseplate upper protein [Staphylococcus sp. GDY8P46P]|uniref:BppU family phage baseplate upper protein n=1 Tax=Staphylococcus sp. GDY8P46P TaxID=2804121 RepID=UPI001AEBED7C|nr:BppU family phage baseplate upper protein [Staphylococcus sp. GDY8P46P]
MRIYKNKDITTNIDTEKMSINNSDTYFYTEDKGSAALRIFINHRKTAFNLDNTNLTPVLDLFHTDGSIWLDEPLEVIMSDKGLLQYNIPDNVIAHAGLIKAKLFLRNTEQSVHVANFTFDIKDSGIEGAVEKEISVNIVETTVKKIMNEQPELFKGEKGDKLTFDDLTDEEKEELKGEQGDKGDTVLAPPKIYTRDEYNKLETKDSNTLYFISEV